MNAMPPRTSWLAATSLAFGILAYLVLPGIGALVAVILGHSAHSGIRRLPPGSVEGDGMALAGLILGWIQIVLVIVVVGLVSLALALARNLR